MTKKLRVAIIGCGGIAKGKHMPSLAKLSQVEMVAFCDIEEERAVEAAAKYGTEDAAVYVDYRELLKDETIEVVHVCTPNDSLPTLRWLLWRPINMSCAKNQWPKRRLMLEEW